MNYYLSEYEFFILFPATFACLVLLLVLFAGLAFWAKTRLKLKGRTFNILLTIAVFSSAVSLWFLLNNVPDLLTDGKVCDLYLQDRGDETRLVVWFTRVDTPAGIATVYSQRLKSYDFQTGKQRGRLDLARRYYLDDYRLFGPFDEHLAWGYSGQNGLKLVSLFEPELLFGQDRILERNPQLGPEIRLSPGSYGYIFNPGTHGLKVATARGEIFEVQPDLRALPAGEVRGGPTRESKEDTDAPHVKWCFDRLPETRAKAVHAVGTALSPERKPLWDPELVSRWGTRALGWNRVWVLHWSEAQGEADCLVSLMKENGEELYQINLNRLLGKPGVRPYAFTFVDGEMVLFVTRKGTTLTALTIDRETGEVLGRTDYF